jgi:hypothetical protein
MRTGTAARHAALGTVAWLLAATGTFAQTPVSDFGQISTRVRVGETVYVTDSAGREHKGMLFDLSASQLVLESGGKRQDFPAGQVATISWRAHDPLGNGALIGMAVGAGFVGIAALSSCDSTECGGWMLLGMLAYGGIGAGIGAGIDALIPGKMIPVYRSASGKQGASLSFSPILSPRRQGLAATVRF